MFSFFGAIGLGVQKRPRVTCNICNILGVNVREIQTPFSLSHDPEEICKYAHKTGIFIHLTFISLLLTGSEKPAPLQCNPTHGSAATQRHPRQGASVPPPAPKRQFPPMNKTQNPRARGVWSRPSISIRTATPSNAHGPTATSGSGPYPSSRPTKTAVCASSRTTIRSSCASKKPTRTRSTADRRFSPKPLTFLRKC